MLNKIKLFINNHFNITAFIVLTIVIFSLYSQTLFFDWVYLDDDVLILDRQEYLSFSNIKNIFTNTVFGQGSDIFCRPILNMTFLFEKYLYGTKPFGYHLTNILLHLFTYFFFFLFLKLYYDKKQVLLICILFACSPAIVQAISWVPGRNDILLAFFIILSLYSFVKYLRTDKYYFFILHVLCFVLSLLTKETAVVVFIFYLAISFYEKKNVKQNLIYLIIWSLLLILYLFYRKSVLNPKNNELLFVDYVKFFVVSIPAIIKYIANVFFPFKLSMFSKIVEIDYLLSLASVLVFVLLFIKIKKYNLKIIIFGILWLISFLLPTFLMPNNVFYDHRIYLSLLGPIIILLELFKEYSRINKGLIIIFLLLFCSFYFVSMFYQKIFKNEELFWINSYVLEPKSDIVVARVADILESRGLYKEAEEKYLNAISLRNYSKHYVNLSVLYIHTNRINEAEKCLLKALELDNCNPNTYYNLALIYKIKDNKEKYEEMKKWFIIVYNDTNQFKKIEDIEI